MSAASPAAGDPLVLREDVDGVTTLTLNRPQQLNALSADMVAALSAALSAIADDRTVRVVVLAGAGKAFCAGHDLKEMREHYTREFQQRLFADCGRMMLSLRALPQPVIARVHGVATAGGCQLAASCDLVVASSAARFATSGIRVGLFCSTPAVALARTVAPKHAMELLLTGEFISAERAWQIGLVNRVVEPEALDDTVRELADAIRAHDAEALALGKRLFYEQLELPIGEAYQRACEVQADNMMLPQTAAGIDAFRARR